MSFTLLDWRRQGDPLEATSMPAMPAGRAPRRVPRARRRPLAVAVLLTMSLVGSPAATAHATHESGHDGFSSREAVVEVSLTSESPSEATADCPTIDGNDVADQRVAPTDLEAGMVWQDAAGPCEASWAMGDHRATGAATIDQTETWVDDDLTRKDVSASVDGMAQGADGVPVTASGEAYTVVELRPTSALSARFRGSWSVAVEGDASVTMTYFVSADGGTTYLLGGVFEVVEGGAVDIGADLPEIDDGVYTVHMGIGGEARDAAPGPAAGSATGAVDLAFTLEPIPSCDITGTPGDDVLVGTRRGERICGRGGNDTIDGRGGNDRILGGSGDDTIAGGRGRDVIDGGDGDDTIDGGPGRDVIDGGDGDDTIDGGPGADQLEGGAGSDTISGGPGPDLILGWGGDDRIDGDGGDDTIHGMAGSDVIDGGPGDDAIWGGLDADEIAGGSGDDDIRGGWGDDSIDGQGGDDRVTGGDGDDTISGGAGADRLDGSAEDDVIDGGNGRDRLIGGAGDDTLLSADGERDRVLGGSGTDTAEVDRRDRVTDVEENP